jgi:hypothetical protein
VRSYHLLSFFSAPEPRSFIDYLIFTRRTGPTGRSRLGPRFIGYSSICTISMSPTEDHSSFCLSGLTSTGDSPRCFSGNSCSACFLICIYPGARHDICYSSSRFPHLCTIVPGLAGLPSSDPGNLTISRQEPSVFADASSHAAIFSGTRMTKMLAATAGDRCSSPSEDQYMGCKATLLISCLCLATLRLSTYTLRPAGFWSGLVESYGAPHHGHLQSAPPPTIVSRHSVCIPSSLACYLCSVSAVSHW